MRLWRGIERLGALLWAPVEYGLAALLWFIDAARIPWLAEQFGFSVLWCLQHGIRWLAQGTWSRNARQRFSQHGYLLLITLIGAYFGLYAILEARHERRANRAAFERSVFIDLVTSGNRGAFITAMRNFGPTQTMRVPKEPRIWPLFEDWWTKSDQPNMQPLYLWALHSLRTCTPQMCGWFHDEDPETYRRIQLRFANLRGAELRWAELSMADLTMADLKGADLHRADLKEADLYRADLKGANLTGADLQGVRDWTPEQFTAAFWDEKTDWPRGFRPPCSRNTPDELCAATHSP